MDLLDVVTSKNLNEIADRELCQTAIGLNESTDLPVAAAGESVWSNLRLKTPSLICWRNRTDRGGAYSG